MNQLETIFAGSSGLSSILHRRFGTSATIRFKTYAREESTGRLIPSFVPVVVPFVPVETKKTTVQSSSPGLSRSDIKEPQSELNGTIPAASVSDSPVSGRDSIVLDGIEYLIESVDVLRVGGSSVQYSISARRC